MTEPVLEVRGVAKRYGSVVALRSAELTVAPGEIHALLGANGAGKSTLVKIMAGVLPADEGELLVDGRPLRPRRPSDAFRAGVATVFQDPTFIPDLTVAENLRLAGIDRRRFSSWLPQLGLAELDLGALVKELPLPLLRLLDLARALAHEPRLLVLDEITAALPGDQAELVFEAMTRHRDAGGAVLFITHRLREVLRMCDRATVLRDGRTVARLKPSEGDESALVEPMLGETVARAATEAEAEAEAAPANPAAARVATPDAPIALEARELRVRGRLNGVTLRLHAGEIVGLVALEGQGQDRLFDVLAGDRPADSGEILVAGEPVRPRSPYDMVRRGVVLVPADRLMALLPQQSLRVNLASALYNRVSRWFRLAPDEASRVTETVRRLDIDTRAARQVRRLSGGNQQKVAIGRWLTAGFRTLLCFDPTRGIDIRTKEQIYGLLRELAADGAAVLYYTSELAEVPLVCDRVLVMYGGAIVHELPAASADEPTLLNAAHGLQEAST
ncbi:MAG TPA: sugar ABC transporter ATP-binding protein [Natronosporangium sp.]